MQINENFIPSIFISLLILCFSTNSFAQSDSYEKAFENYKGKPLPSNMTEMIGVELPNFSGKTIDGELIEINKLRGKVVVLNFWFIACAPCRIEIPALNQLVEQYKNDEVEFISIARDSEKELRNKFFKKHEFNFKTISDPKQKIHKDLLGLQGYPTTIVIDKEGKIRLMTIGGRIDEEMATLDIQTNIAPLIADILK